MTLEFSTKVKEKKIMVRFEEVDYNRIKDIAKKNKESFGRIVRVIVENYLKELK